MVNTKTIYPNIYFVHVEILCTTLRKTLCKSTAKLCAFPHHFYPISVKLYFHTYFSFLSHHVFHRFTTPVFQRSFPLLHIPYYHYYNIYLIIINNKRSLL